MTADNGATAVHHAAHSAGLHKQLGPFPVGMWLVIVGGGVGFVLLANRSKSRKLAASAAAQSLDPTAGGTIQPTAIQGAYGGGGGGASGGGQDVGTAGSNGQDLIAAYQAGQADYGQNISQAVGMLQSLGGWGLAGVTPATTGTMPETHPTPVPTGVPGAGPTIPQGPVAPVTSPAPVATAPAAAAVSAAPQMQTRALAQSAQVNVATLPHRTRANDQRISSTPYAQLTARQIAYADVNGLSLRAPGR